MSKVGVHDVSWNGGKRDTQSETVFAAPFRYLTVKSKLH